MKTILKTILKTISKTIYKVFKIKIQCNYISNNINKLFKNMY